ncbi:MAG: hypothetical protein ACI9FU_000666 [Granulosicoccus sp.]|jgi:hypothetical protein
MPVLIRSLFLAVILVFTNSAYAQLGGSSTYAFLDLVQSARVGGLGGYQTAVKDGDINLVGQNPALLDTSMHQHLTTNFTNYYAGINYGHVAYANRFKKVGMLNFAIQYVGYGSFDQTDVTGNVLGTFNANETAFNVAWSKQLNKYFHFGVNAKAIYSQLASYNSFGMAADFGFLFLDPKTNWSIGLVMNNAGGQFTAYNGTNREPLPIKLHLTLSHRLKYVPLRLSMTIRDLQRPDMTYDDPTNSGPSVDPLTGEIVEDKVTVGDVADGIMRHFVFSGEVYIAKIITASIAYNYGRRQELKVPTKPGTAGFSWGLGIRLNRFHICYSRATYHQAGGTNHISIRTHLGKHIKRARKPKKEKQKKIKSVREDG